MLSCCLLAAALEDHATEPSYALAAADLREKLMHEDGTGYAADVIEETIADYPGNFDQQPEQVMGEAS